MSKQGKLIIWTIVFFFIGVLIASLFWHGDTIYSGAYTPMVEKSNERKAEALQESQQDDNGKPSNQPQAPGFKEKDIDRQHGEGFSTY